MLSFGRSWYIAIFFNENGELIFYFRIQNNYSFVLNVKLSKWYNITIVAEPIDNKKVRKTYNFLVVSILNSIAETLS